MNYRRFKQEDVNDILAIERDAFPNPFNRVVCLFLSSFSDIYVCEDYNKVVGYLILGFENKIIRHIYRIGVSSSYQGKSIGSELMNRYIKGRTTVATREDNKGSIRFYERHGFKLIKRFVKNEIPMVFLNKVNSSR